MTMDPADREVFASKRDIWVVATLWTCIVLLVLCAVVVVITPGSLAQRAVLGLFCVVSAGFVLWTLRGTRYTLEEDRLRIQSGPLHWTVRLESIEGVRQTRSLASGPALSLDRIEIRTRGRAFGVTISPENRQRFVEALGRRIPNLNLES